MAEPTQFTLTHRELVELIIKSANVHEGRWVLSVTFGFVPGNFGPSQDQVSPGTIVAVNQVGIQRELPEMMMPPGLTVDAALVNPAPKGEKPAVQRPRKEAKPKVS